MTEGVQAPTGAELSFEQTVSRGLAHRRSLADVLVTDTAKVGEDEFLVATQLPRTHGVWSDRRSAYHDPLAAVEAGRQLGFVLAHRYYDVPRGVPFVSQQLDFQVEDLEAFRDDRQSPPEGVFRVRLGQKQERADGALVGMGFSGELTIGGSVAKTMSGQMLFLPPADYGGMRKLVRGPKRLDGAAPPARPQPVSAALVDRYDERNVVIADSPAAPSGGESRYALVVDLEHPFFFDHPQDHLPGPLLLEAFRQAAVATVKRAGTATSPVAAVIACRARFSDFAEPEALVECTVSVAGAPAPGRLALSVGVHQLGKQIGEADLELGLHP